LQSETKVQMYTIGLLTHHISHEKYKWIQHRDNVSTFCKTITLCLSVVIVLLSPKEWPWC